MTEHDLRRICQAHGWTLVRQTRRTRDGTEVLQWQARRAVPGGDRTKPKTESVYLGRDAALAETTEAEIVAKLQARSRPRSRLVVHPLADGAVRVRRGARGHGVTLTADEVADLRRALDQLTEEG